jgi:spermidine/putrescine-binding protein
MKIHSAFYYPLILIVLVVSLSLAACTTAAPPQAAPPQADSTQAEAPQADASQTEAQAEKPEAGADSLVVLDWAGYDAPHYWDSFAAQHPDVKVDYTFFEQDADAFAKIQSGFQVDLLHPCSSWWGLYVEAGLVQPIDTARLSNWPDVVPKMAELGQFDGQQYFIPWEWGYESIIVRTDKVDPLPASWADLWDPAYAGHLSIPDTAETNQLFAAIASGISDPYNTTPEEDDLIKQKLIDLKPNVLTYWTDSTELAQLIASGDVWVASNAWPDTFGTLLQDGVPVEYLKPEEGRLGWVCGYGISSQAQDLDLAHTFLDALLVPESIANLGNEFWYGVSNQKAFELLDPEVTAMLQLDQPDILEQTIFYQTMSADHREKIITMWDEVKIAP